MCGCVRECLCVCVCAVVYVNVCVFISGATVYADTRASDISEEAALGWG